MPRKLNLDILFERIIKTFTIIFIFSFPFVLGSDFHYQFNFRYYFSLILFSLAFLYFWVYKRSFLKNAAFFCFLFFLCFEIGRALWAYVSLLQGDMEEQKALLMRFQTAPKFWGSYFGVFCLSYLVFSSRKIVVWFAQGMGWICFLLAINIIPPLLIHERLGYLMESGKLVFFYPSIYFHPWISKYLVGHYAHPNWTGDVIAFGFFSTLGLISYGIYSFFRKKEENSKGGSALLLSGNICLVTAAAIFLIFSRGSILSFILGLSIFFGFVILRYPSRKLILGIILLGGSLFAFVAWAGNLGEAWQEMQTLNKEVSALEKDPDKTIHKGTSIYSNREGAKRALRIYKDYSFLGVGTNGYQSVAKKYASSETWKRYKLSNFQAMCHYLQVLAEEGLGAYLYFIFLLVGCIEVIIRLFKTSSRFQFFLALGFFSFVVMVLFHAAFNHLMQRYAISMMVYAAFGTCFGILSKNFNHENSSQKENFF